MLAEKAFFVVLDNTQQVDARRVVLEEVAAVGRHRAVGPAAGLPRQAAVRQLVFV